MANPAASTLDAVRVLGDSSNENQPRFSDTFQKRSALQQSAQDTAGLSQKLDSQVDQITDAVKTINALLFSQKLIERCLGDLVVLWRFSSCNTNCSDRLANNLHWNTTSDQAHFRILRQPLHH